MLTPSLTDDVSQVKIWSSSSWSSPGVLFSYTKDMYIKYDPSTEQSPMAELSGAHIFICCTELKPLLLPPLVACTV